MARDQALLPSLTKLDSTAPPPHVVPAAAGNVLGPLTAAVTALAIIVFVLAGFFVRPALKKLLLQRIM